MSNDLIPEDVQEKYIVPGLERGLRLLCEFSHKDRVLSAPELARRLKVPRSTVFRLLTTLEVMGFIERVDGGRDFRLGMAVLRLGFEYLASLELTELGRPLLDRLRAHAVHQFGECRHAPAGSRHGAGPCAAGRSVAG